jgi:hypothetical protein
MKKIALLIGSLGILAAGTASAQTSVSLSIGLGEPRPYLEGSVFIGRPYLRPLYRPYYYPRYHRYRSFAPRYYDYRPYIFVPRGHYRRHGFDRVELRRFHRGDDHRFRRDFDRDRARYRRDRFERDDHD